MNLHQEQQAFYRERVPEQFNRTLKNQRSAAKQDNAAARMLEEMEAVRAAIAVRIDDGESSYRHNFEIDRGEMSYRDAPTRVPFMILGHKLEDFQAIRRECGESLLGFLGGLAGLGDEMRLTSQRVRSLRNIQGRLMFERVGAGGFVLSASFGIDTPSAEPRATIRLDEAIYAELRSGRLEPQDAFMDGRIEIDGDMDMAIDLALTALSPD